MHIKKQRLLTPGPTPLLPSALHAMMGSDIHHRTDDFRNLYKRVLADLKEILGTSSDVLVLVSSGSGAMEAAAQNFFSPGDEVLVCSAGKFGERWVEITKAFGLHPTVLTAPYGEAVHPESVEQALRQNKNLRGVFVQASETSTGAQHDVKAMGKAIQRTEAIFVVDAITGIGTMPLDVDGWGLDIVVGGSQKAFMIPPGLAFLSISPKAWAMADSAKSPRYYFDLKREKKNAVNGESAWTPNTALLLAFAEALKFIRSIGMPKLVENAQLLARATREAVTELGLQLFSNSPGSSVTAVRPPSGMDSGVIVKEFRTRFNAIITNGQGSMKGQIFRLAHLGYFDFHDLFAIIAELELILAAQGYPVQFGTGVAAAQNVYAEAALPKEAVALT
ncbi:MAG: alanine--glyoxylate aminotransferase family protein [Acidobacteriaceae bacterium]|nr:alanine--glyoxylate aminotransferase family protein [Acidobacteriaceae bacterium]MBV9779664.1 alanine--glyoxylate aminotransferase family protein [Acidobacteriaceae bacterium]